MTDMLVCDNGSTQVAHHLMHIDQDRPSIAFVKSHWFYLRVNLTPLRCPVSADFIRSHNKTSFKRSRPGHIKGHQRQGGVNVSRVEGCIRCAKTFGV